MPRRLTIEQFEIADSKKNFDERKKQQQQKTDKKKIASHREQSFHPAIIINSHEKYGVFLCGAQSTESELLIAFFWAIYLSELVSLCVSCKHCEMLNFDLHAIFQRQMCRHFMFFCENCEKNKGDDEKSERERE